MAVRLAIAVLLRSNPLQPTHQARLVLAREHRLALQYPAGTDLGSFYFVERNRAAVRSRMHSCFLLLEIWESPETTGEEFLIAPERQLQEITDGLIAYCNAEHLHVRGAVHLENFIP